MLHYSFFNWIFFIEKITLILFGHMEVSSRCFISLQKQGLCLNFFEVSNKALLLFSGPVKLSLCRMLDCIENEIEWKTKSTRRLLCRRCQLVASVLLSILYGNTQILQWWMAVRKIREIPHIHPNTVLSYGLSKRCSRRGSERDSENN